MGAHHGNVHRIPGGQSVPADDDLPRLEHDALGDVEHVVGDVTHGVERRADRIETIDRRIPVQNFLQHLGVGDEPGARRHELLETARRTHLVGVLGADQVHRNVRVDEHRHDA